MLAEKVILWDFDNTLGHRRGLWSEPLIGVLRSHDPESTITHEAIAPFLQTGFPWHEPHLPHLHLNEPDAWWAAMEPVFAQAFVGVGLMPHEAGRLAKRVRETFTHPDGWALYDDTIGTLAALRDVGWSHVIVSNHIPELPSLVSHLGLEGLVDRVYTSALVGYEKPHPEIFRLVLDETGRAAHMWMVGDNIHADIEGARRAGIPGILVRNFHPDADIFCETVAEAAVVIRANNG